MRALESNWALLFEEIGLWMPTEVIYKEHDDKPEGEEEIGNDPVSHVFSPCFLYNFSTTPDFHKILTC